MNNICAYGCNKPAMVILRNGKPCCSNTYQSCEAMKSKNSKGLKKAYKNGVRFVTFSDNARKLSYQSRVDNLKKMPFEYWGRTLQYKEVLKEQDGKCLNCRLDSWLDKPIKLEYDHIDGNSLNNKRENVRLLCPNCHSQTSTFRGRNINSGKVKVTDEEMLDAFYSCNNIHQALIKVGLSPRGGNYVRMKKLLSK